MSHSDEVQKAIYLALTATSPVVAGGRVYDDVPDDPTYPFVHIATSDAIADGVDPGDDGVIETFDLHVFSRERGFKEARDIIGDVRAILHQARLTVTGRSSALAWVRRDRLFLDEDGVTRHGVVSVEVVHRS